MNNKFTDLEELYDWMVKRKVASVTLKDGTQLVLTDFALAGLAQQGSLQGPQEPQVEQQTPKEPKLSIHDRLRRAANKEENGK